MFKRWLVCLDVRHFFPAVPSWCEKAVYSWFYSIVLLVLFWITIAIYFTPSTCFIAVVKRGIFNIDLVQFSSADTIPFTNRYGCVQFAGKFVFSIWFSIINFIVILWHRTIYSNWLLLGIYCRSFALSLELGIRACDMWFLLLSFLASQTCLWWWRYLL